MAIEEPEFISIEKKDAFEVREYQPKLIAQVLCTLKKVFPRESGQGHNVPKFHGMTKMQTYMTLFGSGINIYGGPGEAAHKHL